MAFACWKNRSTKVRQGRHEGDDKIAQRIPGPVSCGVGLEIVGASWHQEQCDQEEHDDVLQVFEQVFDDDDLSLYI